MSKWQEDTLYEITQSIKDMGIEKEFHRLQRETPSNDIKN